jgi:hypothetical protein
MGHARQLKDGLKVKDLVALLLASDQEADLVGRDCFGRSEAYQAHEFRFDEKRNEFVIEDKGFFEDASDDC